MASNIGPLCFAHISQWYFYSLLLCNKLLIATSSIPYRLIISTWPVKPLYVLVCFSLFFLILGPSLGTRLQHLSANLTRCFRFSGICTQADLGLFEGLCYFNNRRWFKAVLGQECVGVWNGKQLTPQRMLQLARDFSGEINIWIYSSILCDNAELLIARRHRLQLIGPHWHRLGI